MTKPLAIDLFCGLGGWTDGLLAEGYDVIGFDIEQHVYGEHRYPAQLVVQDVLTLHGSQFRNVALIVASPPCQGYSYRAMPWKRAKALPPPCNALFDACFRIQREACEASGRHIPLVVENVRGAQPWVGRARWNFGSFYLWGDVPALMPIALKASKVPGFRFDGSGKSFQTASVSHTGVKNGGDWFGSGADCSLQRRYTGTKRPGRAPAPKNGGASKGILGNGLNGGWGEPVPGLGRWPANVVHDGSEEVLAAFPDSDHARGNTKPTKRHQAEGVWAANGSRFGVGPDGETFAGDSGSVARFFYSAKADAGDRLESKHPTVKPVDLMRWLVRLVTPKGGLVLDPFAGSGTTGMACMAEGFDCHLIEREAEYAADIRRRIAHVSGDDTPLFSDPPPKPTQEALL